MGQTILLAPSPSTYALLGIGSLSASVFDETGSSSEDGVRSLLVCRSNYVPLEYDYNEVFQELLSRDFQRSLQKGPGPLRAEPAPSRSQVFDLS